MVATRRLLVYHVRTLSWPLHAVVRFHPPARNSRMVAHAPDSGPSSSAADEALFYEGEESEGEPSD